MGANRPHFGQVLIHSTPTLTNSGPNNFDGERPDLELDDEKWASRRLAGRIIEPTPSPARFVSGQVTMARQNTILGIAPSLLNAHRPPPSSSARRLNLQISAAFTMRGAQVSLLERDRNLTRTQMDL